MFYYSKDIPFSDKMLWVAVLRRAVFDYVLYKGVRQHSLEWKRAYQYLYSPGMKYENGYSFEEVCELFNWDSDYLRRKIPLLTRSDIKKMETTAVRDEFVYDEISSVVEQTERWKTENFAAPFLPLYKYNREVREKLRPRTVQRETYFCSIIPMVRWRTAAA